jgi:hypothetical protein
MRGAGGGCGKIVEGCCCERRLVGDRKATWCVAVEHGKRERALDRWALHQVFQLVSAGAGAGVRWVSVLLRQVYQFSLLQHSKG